jgi:hypothetical protein
MDRTNRGQGVSLLLAWLVEFFFKFTSLYLSMKGNQFECKYCITKFSSCTHMNPSENAYKCRRKNNALFRSGSKESVDIDPVVEQRFLSALACLPRSEHKLFR